LVELILYRLTVSAQYHLSEVIELRLLVAGEAPGLNKVQLRSLKEFNP